ncbi:uncharacterized protein MKK02DRAFT_29563 [Dioszegia hungarica]|uniref:Uncharacterized protein n=1 Tax=Dioszegia hungarica TaxID=4972 RepID=A0AA38HH52_9TREE|nr:uncharacterized protein MKK02DRAFT_29563 [Dioszegia hungarica]KAI9639521.1 hypothetical protein MKK02DRAFT_29563 [Dioszegia hungarica]
MNRPLSNPFRRLHPLRQPTASSSRLAHTQRPHDWPFKPPPIRERLRPLIPFFIWWTVLTSLTVHLLRARQASKESADRSDAKISALQDLLTRARAGEVMSEEEIQRRLELVGVRERRKVDVSGEGREEVRDVGWREAIFGRRAVRSEKEEEEVEDWARSVVAEASGTAVTKPTLPDTSIKQPPAPVATVRRAPSSSRYMS